MSYTIREYRALCEWKSDVCGAIVKMLEENKHHAKFTKRLCQKLQEKLGDRYHVYEMKRSFLSDQLAVIDRTCFQYDVWKNDIQSKLHQEAQIHFGIPKEANWNQQMLDEVTRCLESFTKIIARSKEEEKVVVRLTEINDEMKARVEECRDKARKLLPRWGNCDHYTYPVREMFPELLKDL